MVVLYPTACKRPCFSRNATPHGQALSVGFRKELTLNQRHRNDGFVPLRSLQATVSRRPNLVLPALHLDRPLAAEPAVRLTVYGDSAKSEVWSVAFDRVASKFHVPRE
jgi:hypothetical protein